LNKRDFPRVHFYDQDFVEVYDRTWAWTADCWAQGGQGTPIEKHKYLRYDECDVLDMMEQVFASFFLVYSNRIYPASAGLDALYALQEPSGAIRSRYDALTGKPILTKDNPEGLGLPLFAWAEFNLYHKTANKKRVKDVMPILQAYWNWAESTFRRDNGLYGVPVAATGMENSPRGNAVYLSDFNAAMAMNALYLSALGDILNDKEASFQYKRAYFSLKTRINSLMWNAADGFYYDLDKNGSQIPVKTIGGYWPLLAEIPNEERSERLIAHLRDPEVFGTEHPFPTLAADQKAYDKRGMGYRGSVVPPFTYMVIKGLEKYHQYELARDCAIRHLYFVLDSMHQNGEDKDRDEFGEGSTTRHDRTPTVWEAYLPQGEGKAVWPERKDWPRPQLLAYAGLSTVALMIENIIGLSISSRAKPSIGSSQSRVMGIENLSLKRNLVTILSTNPARLEIHMESEKLYYFTITCWAKEKTLRSPRAMLDAHRKI
jgi:neutral trehalase